MEASLWHMTREMQKDLDPEVYLFQCRQDLLGYYIYTLCLFETNENVQVNINNVTHTLSNTREFL